MNNKGNIILIGFMGTGKTAVGRRLSSILNMDFFDTDQEIETVTGMTIEQIFKKHGETRFRSEENLMVNKLANKTNCIIATGGGMVLDPVNIDILRNTGVLICLNARPEVIHDRVKRRNNRPLLKKGDTYQNIITLLKEREGLYSCSDYIIDTSDLNFDEIINEILEFLKGQSKAHG
ncbi:shikimate kinase [Desulfonispora thiosulfatigenes DSM 11270]|uniref:Shikimate kinase n=1 Tax=Desulfonispora thiosulfatigenes DSM 11270 TaxID=656914 RepID=A0A1W1VMV1_DESTI|nr:shikimate kinase [Desulfonispora thiosulfatigenes]SMB94692.1 shikimate kinase [Desulfonispora thiosulfatigenes DSM 11270]